VVDCQFVEILLVARLLAVAFQNMGIPLELFGGAVKVFFVPVVIFQSAVKKMGITVRIYGCTVKKMASTVKIFESAVRIYESAVAIYRTAVRRFGKGMNNDFFHATGIEQGIKERGKNVEPQQNAPPRIELQPSMKDTWVISCPNMAFRTSITRCCWTS
jgi:hypothetical protein